MICLIFLLLWSLSHASEPRTGVCVRKAHPQDHEISLKADSFKELVEDSTIFVDKSLLIKEIIECPAKVILITVPKKWGKSINLDMIKTFFEIEVDKHGHEVLPKNNTRNYKLFHGHITWMRRTIGTLKSPFLISGHTELFERYQGKHPVILIDLQDIDGENFEDMFKSLTNILSKIYKQHHYMPAIFREIIHNKDTPEEKRKEAQFNLDKFTRSVFDEEVDRKIITESIKYLCKILYEHFGKKVYILIDNYEKPFIKMLHNKNFIKMYTDNVIEYFAGILESILKDNEYMEKAIITGALSTCTELLLPELQSFVEYTFINNPWAEFYGFHEKTVSKILKNIQIAAGTEETAREWYSGYRMGTQESVYNPWSLANFVYHGQFRNYWDSMVDTYFLLDVLPVRPIRALIESLVHGQKISGHLHKLHFTKSDILHLKHVADDHYNCKLQPDTIDLIVSRLCANAHLTVHNISYDSETHTNITYLTLPNIELVDEMFRRLLYLYQFKDRLSSIAMTSIVKYLIDFINNDYTNSLLLENQLRDFFSCLSIYKYISKKKTIDKVVETNMTTVHSILNYLVLELRFNHKFNVTMYEDPAKPDIVMHKNDLGAVVKFMFQTMSGKSVWQKFKSFADIFQSNDEVQSVKVIGIAVSLKKIVDIYATVIHKDHSNT